MENLQAHSSSFRRWRRRRSGRGNEVRAERTTPIDCTAPYCLPEGHPAAVGADLEAVLDPFRQVATALPPDVATEPGRVRGGSWPPMRQVTQKSDSHAMQIGRKSDRYRSEIGQVSVRYQPILRARRRMFGLVLLIPT
jgi:hypothetical protein